MSQITIYFVYAMQIAIAFGLLNVWIVRFNRNTIYRGSNAHNMKEEFAAYNLPVWFMYAVGFLKVVIALVMIATLVLPNLMYPVGFYSLVLLSGLIIGAISMHIKIKDSLIKMIPAIVMFAMTILILSFSFL